MEIGSVILDLKVNDTFHSYDELNKAIILYEKRNRVQFWKRDCKTLQSAKNHCPKLYGKANTALKYYVLKYCCIHGGQAFRPKESTAKKRRLHESTFKQGCPAYIKVSLSEDGQALVIKNITTDHNHDIPTMEIFKQLPKQRRLADEHKKTALAMIKLKANKKLLQAELVQNTYILLRDLTNLAKSSLKDNFPEIISLLKEKHSCTVDILAEENTFKSMFFQDRGMKQCFALFPEMLFMDGTYKLLNIRCPVYIMAVENSFGTTDIVGIGIITKEDSESTGWLLQRFKERNLEWNKIKVVMTDKSATERDVISKEFPGVKKLICLFHTLQIFQREITASKLNLTPEQVKKSLEYLSKLAHAKSEVHYYAILEQMKKNVPVTVMSYFSKNWEKIEHEWVKGFTKNSGNFFNYTNNRLESLNSKLKSVISTYSTFKEFIDKLFILIKIRRSEKQNVYSRMVLRVPKELSAVNYLFYKQLTNYAYKKIEKNLNDVQVFPICPYTFNTNNMNTVVCISNSDTFAVSETTCDCSFFISMQLPCSHILFYRKFLGLELYNDSLCNRRWTRAYIQELYNVSLPTTSLEHESFSTIVSNLPNSCSKPLNSHEKFKKAQAICLNLATMCSEISTTEFRDRINLLLQLERSWQNHETVQIINSEVYHESTNNLAESLNISVADHNNRRVGQDCQNLDPSVCSWKGVFADHNYSKVEHDSQNLDISVCSWKDGFADSDGLEQNRSNPSTSTFMGFNKIGESDVIQSGIKEELICDMNYAEIVDDDACFYNIHLPEQIKHRGRPKGRSLTAIGLLRKKKKL